MSSILVTGGSGLVGSHLREILPDATYISSSEFDLRSENDVKRLFEREWSRVIHLAARVGGIIDNINYPLEFIEDNLRMNTNLVRQARLSGVPRFTAVLSTCIYPDTFESYPLVEEDLHSGPPQSTNFAYAIAKRALAVHIDAANKQFETSYNYVIPCNLYGPYDRFDPERSHYLTALIGKIIRAERSGTKRVELLGTGKPLRQFMYAGDLAAALKKIVVEDITDSFNVATSENRSIREIAEIAIEACGATDFELSFDQVSPDGQFRKDVSNQKMLEAMPGFTFTPLKEGIRTVYEAYKKKSEI
ncbi:MAG: NAD-dependent epimerase/dehydratase family protein [Pyrinomonadaceae bacterium]